MASSFFRFVLPGCFLGVPWVFGRWSFKLPNGLPNGPRSVFLGPLGCWSGKRSLAQGSAQGVCKEWLAGGAEGSSTSNGCKHCQKLLSLAWEEKEHRQPTAKALPVRLSTPLDISSPLKIIETMLDRTIPAV